MPHARRVRALSISDGVTDGRPQLQLVAITVVLSLACKDCSKKSTSTTCTTQYIDAVTLKQASQVVAVATL